MVKKWSSFINKKADNNIVHRIEYDAPPKPPPPVPPRPPWQQGHSGYDPSARDPNGYQWDMHGRVIPQMRALSQSEMRRKEDRRKSLALNGDRSMRAYNGWYGMLGNPHLQSTLDAHNDYARQNGSAMDKTIASLSQLPQTVVGSVGAQLTLGAGARAYPALMGAIDKYWLPFSVADGTKSGIEHGIETGSVSQGLKSGLANTAATYVGGKLFSRFPKTMLTLTSGVPLAMSAVDYAMSPSKDYADKAKQERANMVSMVKEHPEHVTNSEWMSIMDMHSKGLIDDSEFSEMHAARRRYLARRLSEIDPRILQMAYDRYNSENQ